jgi:hypothetical protein
VATQARAGHARTRWLARLQRGSLP